VVTGSHSRHRTHVPSFGNYDIIRYCCSALTADKVAALRKVCEFLSRTHRVTSRRW